MARPFTTYDVKKIISDHKDLLTGMKSGIEGVTRYHAAIQQIVKKIVASEAIRTLQGIPVEEISRYKKGVRVSALHNGGYHTMADVFAVSSHTLASLYGISFETASAIKMAAADLFAQSQKGVKIRLSVDRKSQGANDLVQALYQYRSSKNRADFCSAILGKEENSIQSAIYDLAPAEGAIRWFFTSKKDKQKAINGFDYLGNLIHNDYGRTVQQELASFERIAKYTTEEAWSDFQRNSISYYNVLESIAPGVLGTDDVIYGLPEELAQQIRDECFFPDGLLCELRRYQEWGVKYILHQERVLLGDEMGLGKTVQAIATMVSLKNVGATHFLVVCPASVLTNWCREISRHSRLTVTRIHGAERQGAIRSWTYRGGVGVTTYETIGAFRLDDRFHLDLLVVDEAHYIKNADAQRTKNAKAIAARSKRLLFMTGTALENKVDEMVSLISILRPEIAARIRGMEALSAAPQFRKIIAPVYYRRKREDVLTELPELIENEEWCTMTGLEEEVYEQAMLNHEFAMARRVSWNVDNLRFSSKARRLFEIVEEASAEGRKVIVFSFFLDTLKKVENLFYHQTVGQINGSVSVNRRQEIIDRFDSAPAGTVLAAQIQSGGTGLNIQTASVVVICEPQLKPSIENQAISRAYRMGQTRNVLVYRLLCEGSIDERITELLTEKQRLFDAFADKSVAAQESLAIDEKTLGNIIEEEIKRIKAKKGETI